MMHSVRSRSAWRCSGEDSQRRWKPNGGSQHLPDYVSSCKSDRWETQHTLVEVVNIHKEQQGPQHSALWNSWWRGFSLRDDPSWRTRRSWSMRNDPMQSRLKPSIPIPCSFKRRRLWVILSNAFIKSSSIVSIWWPLSINWQIIGREQ